MDIFLEHNLIIGFSAKVCLQRGRAHDRNGSANDTRRPRPPHPRQASQRYGHRAPHPRQRLRIRPQHLLALPGRLREAEGTRSDVWNTPPAPASTCTVCLFWLLGVASRIRRPQHLRRSRPARHRHGPRQVDTQCVLRNAPSLGTIISGDSSCEPEICRTRRSTTRWRK